MSARVSDEMRAHRATTTAAIVMCTIVMSRLTGPAVVMSVDLGPGVHVLNTLRDLASIVGAPYALEVIVWVPHQIGRGAEGRHSWRAAVDADGRDVRLWGPV